MMHFLGLSAWVLFAFAFASAIRARFAARISGGIARQHRLHHWLGLTTGLLVLTHASYEIWNAPDVALAIFDDPFLLLAWIAAILLVLGLLSALLRRLPQRLWVLIHWSLVISFAAALAHGLVYLHSEDIDRIVFYTMTLVAAISIISILFVRIVSRIWIIESVTKLSPTMHEILLSPRKKGGEGFKAGAIVFAQLGPGFSRAWHPFSVASCRFNPVMRLLIKSVGKDTAHLQDLHAGDEMRIHGPFVEFHVRHEQDQVWIAGGVGVAPFLGMVRCLDFRGSGEIRLIQYEGAEEPALESELREFQARHPQFRSQTIVTSKADFHELGGLLDSLNNPVFLVCGPPSFMRAVRKSLVKLGIQSSHIHTEEFSPW